MVERIIDDDLLARLRTEAEEGEAATTPVSVPLTDAVDERRGMPDRRLRVLEGGVAVTALLWSEAVTDRLHELTGRPWVPLGMVGHYSYYDPGSHLGVHRDADHCDISVITIVADDDESPALIAYPSRIRESVDTIRARPGEGRVEITARPGDSVIVYGGIVPHAVPTLGPHRHRIVAPLCYRPAG